MHAPQDNRLITRPYAMVAGGLVYPGSWAALGMAITYDRPGIGSVDLYVINTDARNEVCAAGAYAKLSCAATNVVSPWHAGIVSPPLGDELPAGDNNSNKPIGIRLQLSGLHSGFNVGASAVYGKWDDASKLYSYRVGGHLVVDSAQLFETRWLPTVQVEAVGGVDQHDSSVMRSASVGNGDTSAMAYRNRKVFGAYAQLAQPIYGDLLALVRYDVSIPDLVSTGKPYKEMSFGLNLLLVRGVRLKAEYTLRRAPTTDPLINYDLAAFEAVAFF